MSHNTEILTPFLPKVMDGLLTMATQSTDDVLALVLESLRIVMSVSRLLLQTRSHDFALEPEVRLRTVYADSHKP